MNERVTHDTFFLPFARALLTALAHQPLVLMMDGSTAGRGCLVLMLSLRYRGRALPLAWIVVRGKKGHFPATTHQSLADQVAYLIPPEASVIFLGDGEFDSTDLHAHLEHLGWTYVCRTAKNTLIWWGGDTMLHLSDLLVPQGESLAVHGAEVTATRYGPVLLIIVWEHGYEHPLYLVRTYAVARLWAIPACGKPHKTALGSVRNCRMAGRMMFILVVKRDAPVSSSCQIRRKYVRRAHPI